MVDCVAGKEQTEEFRALLLIARPPFPSITEGARVDIHEMESLREGGGHFFKDVRPITVKHKELWRLRIAWAFGFSRAVFLEHTASDLLLPYVLGVLAVVCAAATILAGHIPWRIN